MQALQQQLAEQSAAIEQRRIVMDREMSERGRILEVCLRLLWLFVGVWRSVIDHLLLF